MITIITELDIVGMQASKTKDGKTAVHLLEVEDMIPLRRGPSFPPSRGEWFLAPDGNLMIVCMECGAPTGILPSVHTVRDDGAMQPSYICPSCGWHVFVRLVGWGDNNTRKDPNA